MKSGWCCAVFVLLAGCAELPDIESGTCGNAVWEPEANEDCDIFVDQSRLPGGVCRPRGVVGECHFDCQLGVDGKRPWCPKDMACASDGICRKLTDELAAKVKLSSDVASWVSAIDFDGDQRAELVSTEPTDQLQQARFRLHYFDRDGDLEETRVFPRITTRPVARELDGSRGDDLVFSNLRVGMMFGRSDREWVPEALSSYVVPNDGLRAVSVRNDTVEGATALAAFTTLGGVSGVFVPSTRSDAPQLLPRAEFSRPLTDLAGEPIAADLITGVDSPCDEVAFAFRGDDRLRVLDMCRLGDPGTPAGEAVWRDKAREQTVRMPSGKTIEAGPLAADVNGDGRVDLLIGDGQHAYVAYSDGTTLTEVAELLERRIYFDYVHEPLLSPLPLPLAAGDVTGDGIADFVLPDSVLASRIALDGSLSYFFSYGNNAEPWTMARVADLNGNGLPDVVAASAGALGLTFLNGTGGPYQVPARLGSHAALRFLTIGDFDGDLIGDTAFIEDDPASPGVGVLAVAFGRRDGTPLPATRIAQMRGVTQLGSYGELGLDALMAASLVERNGVRRGALTLFDGNPDRLPFAPYTLVPFSADGTLQDQMALALSAGAFTRPNASDVVVLGTFSDLRSWDLWLLPRIAAEQQPPQKLALVLPVGALPHSASSSGVAHLSLASGAGDLDGGGQDESLWLMPWYADVEREVLGAVDGCALLAYDIDGAALEAHERLRLVLEEPCPNPELLVRDLDGDEAVDLMLLIGDPTTGRRIRILWNDGRGGFSTAASSELSAPSSGSDAAPDLRAMTVLPGEPLRVAFLAAHSLYMAAARGRSFDEVREVASFNEAQAVTTLDVNADRVMEVVVADAQGIWLLPRQLR